MSSPPQTVTLSRDEVSQIVSKGVQDAFVKMGMQVEDPIQMQRDFQYLREWRESMDAIKRKGFITAIGMIISGFLAVAWLGLKALVEHRGGG